MRMVKAKLSIALLLLLAPVVWASPLQTTKANDDEFGPVVRAYLGYLRNEQEVVDDRASRHEVSAVYYRRNSNRIKALRQMAIRLARESQNDYLPELEAVTADELTLLFEKPPNPVGFRVGQVLKNTFRYLGMVKSSEPFYVFARLDPYEQADQAEKDLTQKPLTGTESGPRALSRSRRVVP